MTASQVLLTSNYGVPPSLRCQRQGLIYPENHYSFHEWKRGKTSRTISVQSQAQPSGDRLNSDWGWPLISNGTHWWQILVLSGSPRTCFVCWLQIAALEYFDLDARLMRSPFRPIVLISESAGPDLEIKEIYHGFFISESALQSTSSDHPRALMYGVSWAVEGLSSTIRSVILISALALYCM